MHKLNFLKRHFSHLPAQGTDEWLASRRTRFGGSEVAAVVGKCPYKSSTDMLKSKTEMTFTPSAACSFGRIMEPVAKAMIEIEGHTIHEFGAIPSTDLPLCYSPDGLIVDKNELVLLEIKCPWRRSKIAEVPKHYTHQIQAGMHVLPCTTTWFYQFRFRLCSRAQMKDTPDYNRWIHCEGYKRCPKSQPLSWGYLHFEGEEPLVDLGKLSKDNEMALCKLDRRPFTIHIKPKEFPNTGILLPFKLMDKTKVVVAKDPSFMETHSDKLWTAFDTLLTRESKRDS